MTITTSEATTNSAELDELMSRDPLSLTEPDLDKIVKILRGQRQTFLITEQLPKGKNKISAPVGLTADDLGL